METNELIEVKSAEEVVIWRMLAINIAIFLSVCIFIVIAFPDNSKDLLFYFTYVTIACTFVPLPTPPVVILYGQRYSLLYGQWYGPLLVATLGAIGFCISAIIDYSAVTLLFRNGKVRKVKNTKTFAYIQRFYNKNAFITLVIGAFTPIPVDPIKFVACATRYSRFKYILACFVGRFPRYLILAWNLPIPQIYLYASIPILIAIAIIIRLIKRWKRKE